MVRSKAICNYFEDHHDEMLEFLKELAMMETPSRKPSTQDQILTFLSEKLKSLNYKVIRMPGKVTGGYIMARPEQRAKDSPIQLLIGHCDTVWAEHTLDEMPLSQGNGQLKGPGVYDMKAGLTQMIFAIQAVRDLKLDCPVTSVLLINSDEEIGSRESSSTIRRLAKIANRAFVLEPPLGLDGKLKTARKGLGRFTLKVKGKPAHAGLDPGGGASAIVELSHQIQKLFALNDPEKGITVNVGMIEGGISPNVIAPESKAVIDVRVLSHSDGDYVKAAIMNLQPVDPLTSLETDGFIGRPPMERTERNVNLWQVAKETAEKMGVTLEQGTAGGGSDGNTTSLYTATLDGLGTAGDGAHAHHEFIFTDSLIERSTLLTLLLVKEKI